MLELTRETRLALSPMILLRSVPSRDSYYAFDIGDGDQFRLNRTSYWILEAVGTGILWWELSARFLETFDVASADALHDLAQTVDQSLRDGITRRIVDGEEGR